MTPTPNPPALLPVIQADRDAAADYLWDLGLLTPIEREGVKAGKSDATEYVQAFARHRLQSTTAEPKVSREAVASGDDGFAIECLLSKLDAEGFDKTAAAVRRLALSNPPTDGDGWRDISTIPDDAPSIVGLWVTNNKTGQRWWESYLVSIDDETGEAISWPEGEPLPWALQDFEGWQPAPEPPSAPLGAAGQIGDLA